jgi:hypothetical protein
MMMAQFDAGDLCCSNVACALVKTDGAWEKLPHQTEVSFNSQVSVNGLVTSDTGGREGVSCGTTATTGTIGLACHDGTEARFAVNTRYRIRMARVCADIWTPESGSDEYGSPVADPEDGTYWEGIVLITGEPMTLTISASDTPIVVWPWTLDGDWIAEPATIVPDLTA